MLVQEACHESDVSAEPVRMLSITPDERMPLTADAATALKGTSTPVDLLRRLLQGSGSAATALQAMGINCAALAADLPPGQVDDRWGLVAHNAAQEASLLGHRRVASVHLLLALMYRDSPQTASLLEQHGVTLYDLRRFLQSAAAIRQTARWRRASLPSVRAVVRPSPIFLVPTSAMALTAALLVLGLPAGLVGIATTGFVVSGWITSLCLHEFGHALVAYLGGDRSVVGKGYLTLNPLKYTHPLLSIVLPVVFVILGGIGLPGGAVYIDHRALRSRRWDALVSAAGPLATLLFALVVALPLLLLPADWWFTRHLLELRIALDGLVLVEVGALLLNLLPIPPLDGFGIVAGLCLSWEARLQAARYAAFGMLLVYFLLWHGPLAPVFQAAVSVLAGLLHVS